MPVKSVKGKAARSLPPEHSAPPVRRRRFTFTLQITSTIRLVIAPSVAIATVPNRRGSHGQENAAWSEAVSSVQCVGERHQGQIVPEMPSPVQRQASRIRPKP